MNNLKQEHKVRVEENDLEIIGHSDGGYMTYHYQGKPFSGYMVIDYHENGDVMYEEEYREGEHMGWDNVYYENGQIERETLMYGATGLEFYKYDEEGNLLIGGKQVPDDIYDKIVAQNKLLD